MKKNSILFTLFSLLSLGSFAQPNITLNLFSSGYSNPVDIANAGDSRIFLVEQGGNIWILDSLGNKQTTPFLTKSVTSGGERGLLGLAFDPDYATNGYFYIHYSQGSNGRIARYSVSSTNPNQADPASETIVLTIPQPFSNHNGGDLAFGPDGFLYIGLGDGGSAGDPGNRSQDRMELLGKMLRIDVSTLPYTIPASNPFVGDPTTLDEIWALGLRNPWRFSFDKSTGDLWIGDVGQSAREEINFTPASSTGGENYGWRCYEGDLTYNTAGCGPAGNYEFPAYDLLRSQGTSITGGFVYRGQKSQLLDGIYFFGDYGSGRLWGIWPDASNPGSWITYEFLNTPYQWSTFGEDQHGEVYGADYNSGNIYRIDGPCATFSISLNSTDASCATAQNGTASIATTGSAPLDSILWSTGDIQQTITNLDTGLYTVTVIDSNGCVGTATAQVQFGTIPVPAIVPQGPTQICPGNSLLLVADPAPAGFSYQWFLNGTLLSGFTTQTFSTTAGGDFQVTYTGPCSVDTSSVIQVQNVPSPPAPAIGGNPSGTYCEDEIIVLTSSSAPNGFFYQWFQDGTPLSINSDSLLITSDGSYSVQYDGPCASPISLVVNIQIETVPNQPSITAMDSVICESGSTVLEGPTAPTGYMHQWYLDGMEIMGANQQTYTASDEGSYSLTFLGICESALAEDIQLAVSMPDPMIDQIGDSLSTDIGTAWQWYLDGNIIQGAISQSYFATESGAYSVIITNEFGCTGTSDEVFVSLTSLEEWVADGKIIVSPNPAYGQVEVSFDLLKQTPLEISLSDLQGRILTSKVLPQSIGNIRASFSTEKLAAGIYLVSVKGNEMNYSTRLVVRK